MINTISSLDVVSKIAYIVSDLHLAEGEQDKGLVLGTENFLNDSIFCALMNCLLSKGEQSCLIINGDFVDFIRMTPKPESEAEIFIWKQELLLANIPTDDLNFTLDRKEKKYGLKTNDYKSIYKLYLAIRGHLIFFKALAEFVDNGNELVINIGNHDPEWYWSAMQTYLRNKLFTLLPDPVSNKEDFNKRISFKTNEFSLYDSILVEHGHQFERVTATDTAYEFHLVENKNRFCFLSRVKTPKSDRDKQLHLSFGSFFNRYVINEMEKSFPNVDNLNIGKMPFQELLKENYSAVFRIFKDYMLYAIFVFPKYYGKFIWNYAQKILLFLLPFGLFIFLYLHSPISNLLAKTDSSSFFYKLVSWYKNLPQFILTSINGAVNVVLPLVFRYALKSLMKWMNFTDKSMEEAAKAKITVNRDYQHFNAIVVGHNHNAEKQILKNGKMYINSGTWTNKYEYKFKKIHEGFHPSVIRIRKGVQNEIDLMKFDIVSKDLVFDKTFINHEE